MYGRILQLAGYGATSAASVLILPMKVKKQWRFDRINSFIVIFHHRDLQCCSAYCMAMTRDVIRVTCVKNGNADTASLLLSFFLTLRTLKRNA